MHNQKNNHPTELTPIEFDKMVKIAILIVGFIIANLDFVVGKFAIPATFRGVVFIFGRGVLIVGIGLGIYLLLRRKLRENDKENFGKITNGIIGVIIFFGLWSLPTLYN